MLGGRLLQGLAFSALGCFVVPIAKPSLFSGISFTKVSSDNVPEVVKPKQETFLKLLLEGKSEKEGLVFELNRGEEESSQWKLSKVTWHGKNWNRNWILYYDHIRREHSFIDKFRIGGKCLGYTVYWDNDQVCLDYGRVPKEDLEKWVNKFPKIKFNGWSSWLWRNGYSAKFNLPNLNNCSVKLEERKIEENNSLIAVISCSDGALLKRINTSDSGGMLIEKR